MKIVYCIGALFQAGGTERVMVNKANYFADVLGYEVHLLIANQQNKPYCFEISTKVKVHDMNVVSYLRAKKVIKGWSFLQMLFSLRKVYQDKINQIQPDIISVLELGYEDFLVPFLQTRAVTIREIHSSHEAQKKIKLESRGSLLAVVTQKIQRYFINKFDAVVVLTNKDCTARTYFKNKYVIPNAIDFGATSLYTEVATKAISIGRLDRFKNFSEQVIIWSQVVKDFPTWTLHIYGEGPDKKQLEQQIATLNLQQHVFLEGTTNKVKDKLAEASLFLFTSVAEGFGMVLVEAMQVGLPVVAYDCPCGPSEIITNNKDGFLVPMHDAEQFKDKVVKLITSESLRLKMSEEALQSSQQFKTSQVVPKWILLFEQLIAKKSKKND